MYIGNRLNKKSPDQVDDAINKLYLLRFNHSESFNFILYQEVEQMEDVAFSQMKHSKVWVLMKNWYLNIRESFWF